MKKRTPFILLILFLCLSFPSSLESANLTSVKDTLETSMLSYHAKNAGDLSLGSIIQVAGSGTPSTDTSNLFPGDTIKYITSENTYTVDQIIDADEFSITTSLASTDDDADDEFVIIRTAGHTVVFTPATAIPNGALRVRIKAGASNNNNTNPDQDGFDFNSITAANVACPSDDSYYNFVAGTATVSGGTNCAAGYHCFECRYSGTGSTDPGSMTIGIGTTGSVEMVNPSAASGHSIGTADTHLIKVENLDSGDDVIDSTDIRVAILEAVRVTATVDPTIQLTIVAVTSGQSRCGHNTMASSTAVTVPFGSLGIGSTGNVMSQQISAVTNASGGYAVTVFEDDQLSINGAGVTEIADTDCDAEDCSTSSSGDWHSETTESGFGYSIQNIDADTVPFQYNNGCTTNLFCARPFPVGSDSAVNFMSNTSLPASTEDLYMCYKIVASTSQQAGNYENRLIYTATATF